MAPGGHQRLTEAAAKQVLARAAQLDATSHASVSIGDLRTAALEAGIAPSALDRALDEMTGAGRAANEAASAPAEARRRTRRGVWIAIVAAAVTLAGALGVLRAGGGAPPFPPAAIEIEVPPAP